MKFFNSKFLENSKLNWFNKLPFIKILLSKKLELVFDSGIIDFISVLVIFGILVFNDPSIIKFSLFSIFKLPLVILIFLKYPQRELFFL